MSHAFYLWSAYAMTAVAIAAEVAWLFVRRARALAMIEEERELEAQD